MAARGLLPVILPAPPAPLLELLLLLEVSEMACSEGLASGTATGTTNKEVLVSTPACSKLRMSPASRLRVFTALRSTNRLPSSSSLARRKRNASWRSQNGY